MRGVIFATEYSIEHGRTVTYLIGRDENRKRVKIRDESIQPHFYVPADAKNTSYKAIVGARPYHLQTEKGDKVKIITTRTPGDVRALRLRYKEAHQADIPFEDVYMIQKGLTGGFEIENGEIVPCDKVDVAPRILYIDIEVASREEFPSPALTRYPIICIGCYDSYECKLHIFYTHDLVLYHENAIMHKKKNEVSLLHDFIMWLRKVDPDYIAGWNVRKFDLAYLINRAFCFNLPANRMSIMNRTFVRADGTGRIRGRRALELRDAYFKKLKKELPSYSLEYIAKTELGETLDHTITDFETTWLDAPTKIIKRNYKHVKWLVDIDKKRDLSNYFEKLRRKVGCSIEKVFSHNKIVDTVLLRECKDSFVKSGMIGKKERTYKAAIVLDPIKGLHFNVIVLDFKTTYPSIMIDHNLPPGLIPKVIKRFLIWRAEVKNALSKETNPIVKKTLDLDQAALKSIGNSFYGVLGAGSSRWRDLQYAEKITAKGREYLMQLKEEAKKRGYVVLAGDTDSIFILAKTDALNEEGLHLAKELTEAMKEYIKGKYNIDSRISVELDRVFKALIIKDKKFYAGYTVGNGKLEFEVKNMIKKGNMSEFTCATIEEVIKLILDGKYKSIDTKYFENLWNKFSAAKASVICPPATLRKDPRSYDRADNVLRGVAYSNLWIGTSFSKGDRFKVAPIKECPRGVPFTDSIAFVDEVPKGYIIDKRKLFNSLKTNIKEICDIVAMKQQTKMEAWL